MKNKAEYYLDIISRLFRELPPEKYEIVSDGVYRSRLLNLARIMVEDLETDEYPEVEDAIAKLNNFADTLEATIADTMGNMVAAPAAFMNALPPDGSQEWLPNLITQLDEYLVYPEKDLLLLIVNNIYRYKQDRLALIESILDSIVRPNSSFLNKTFIEALTLWADTEIEQLEAAEPEDDWNLKSVLNVVLSMGNFFRKSSSFYGNVCYQIAIACYETVIKHETDSEKVALANNFLSTCLQKLGETEKHSSY